MLIAFTGDRTNICYYTVSTSDKKPLLSPRLIFLLFIFYFIFIINKVIFLLMIFFF